MVERREDSKKKTHERKILQTVFIQSLLRYSWLFQKRADLFSSNASNMSSVVTPKKRGAPSTFTTPSSLAKVAKVQPLKRCDQTTSKVYLLFFPLVSGDSWTISACFHREKICSCLNSMFWLAEASQTLDSWRLAEKIAVGSFDRKWAGSHRSVPCFPQPCTSLD